MAESIVLPRLCPNVFPTPLKTKRANNTSKILTRPKGIGFHENRTRYPETIRVLDLYPEQSAQKTRKCSTFPKELGSHFILRASRQSEHDQIPTRKSVPRVQSHWPPGPNPHGADHRVPDRTRAPCSGSLKGPSRVDFAMTNFRLDFQMPVGARVWHGSQIKTK